MKTIKLIVVGPATEKAKQDLIVSEILEGMSEWKNQILHFGRASRRTHLAKKIEERKHQQLQKRCLLWLDWTETRGQQKTFWCDSLHGYPEECAVWFFFLFISLS